MSTIVLGWLWIRGVRHLMAHDPTRPRRTLRIRDLLSPDPGLTPTYGTLLRCGWRYFRRSYHPVQEGSTSQAVAYLASSPAALAAEHG